MSLDKNFSQLALTEALNLWLNTLKKDAADPKVRNATIEFFFYETAEKLIDDVNSNSFEFINMNSWNYFALNLGEKIEPFLLPSKSSVNKFEKYLLVGKTSNDIKDFSELKNTKINIPNSASAFMMEAWAKVITKENLSSKNYATVSIFSSGQDEVTSLLSVFFNKFDYTVIRETSYQFACEMNPQLKKTTQILTSSGNYISYFLSHRKNIKQEIIQAMFDQTYGLPSSAEGEQMLEILQIKSIYPLEKADFLETEILYNKHKKYFSN